MHKHTMIKQSYVTQQTQILLLLHLKRCDVKAVPVQRHLEGHQPVELRRQQPPEHSLRQCWDCLVTPVLLHQSPNSREYWVASLKACCCTDADRPAEDTDADSFWAAAGILPSASQADPKRREASAVVLPAIRKVDCVSTYCERMQ